MVYSLKVGDNFPCIHDNHPVALHGVPMSPADPASGWKGWALMSFA
jgi:hypothetical protein